MTAELRTVEIPPQLTVRELAEQLDVSPIAVIKELMNNGIMASINQPIDFDTAAIVGEEMGFEIIPVQEEELEPAAELEKAVSLRHQFIEDEDPANLEPRPPVVTILGHVESAIPTLLRAKQVVLRNISVHTRWPWTTGKLPSWIHRGTRLLPQCVPVAQWSPTLLF